MMMSQAFDLFPGESSDIAHAWGARTTSLSIASSFLVALDSITVDPQRHQLPCRRHDVDVAAPRVH
ncbi:hypothetical protein AB0K09_31970, partial [Streptomyces sp. NPDC049577]|uniref:hypothetical protein n=1 Tax=Streptomyces sp. NPDC049577 TaxID=3155153 RepID=UPI00342ABCE9